MCSAVETPHTFCIKQNHTLGIQIHKIPSGYHFLLHILSFYDVKNINIA